jgi:hypothetical protein
MASFLLVNSSNVEKNNSVLGDDLLREKLRQGNPAVFEDAGLPTGPSATGIAHKAGFGLVPIEMSSGVIPPASSPDRRRLANRA